MTIHAYSSATDAARSLVGRILQVVDGFPAQRTVGIALSGGSTPALLFRLWAEESGGRTPWERIRLFWVDERCVPPTDPESNYGMTKKNLLDKIPIPETNVLRIKGEDDPEEEALRYALQAEALLDEEEGCPKFDIVLLGIGEDGHTASIFPGQEHLLTDRRTYAVGIHPASGRKRITLTGRPLLRAGHLFFLAAGETKKQALAALHGLSDSVPAAYVAHHARHDVEVFADRNAAPLLPEADRGPLP